MVINRVLKKLPEQMGLHCYAVSIHRDELVLEPPLKNPGSAYGDPPSLDVGVPNIQYFTFNT